MDLDKESLELKIATNSHSKNELLFIKHFYRGHDNAYQLYDVHKSVLPEILNIFEKEYKLEEIYASKSIYEIDDEIDETPLGLEDVHLETDFDSDTIKIDIKKRILIKSDNDSIYIYSLGKIDGKLIEEIEKLHSVGCTNRNKSSVHILSHTSDRGMYLSDFKINDKFIELDINSNYNDDFEPIHDKIVNELDSDKIGLYLLHGTHGTGKTTYIRHLIRKIDKRVIFVSPSMADQFSTPEMIPFLMRYPNSVIVIEDAENIIKTRHAGGNQAVSNLLNLSDGILGDCLKFQIICTFNTDKHEIDEALSRKGRLIESYEFDKLSLNKTNKLLETLGHGKSDVSLRLSDIYNPEENHFELNESKVGFKHK